MAGRAYLQLRGVSVGYRGHVVAGGIDADIERGRVVALIGPNGAGKSTILKSIARQLQLIDGAVVLDGRDIFGIAPSDLARHMAVMLTDAPKPELLTCYDVVATGRYPYTGRLGLLRPEDERAVERAMQSVHAEELGGRDFTQISDGQRQRVLLARAICQEPDVMVLDEPTSYLDVRHKLDFLSIVRGMAKREGIAVVMSLHEIDLAMKAADEVICVKGGRVVRAGSPDRVFDEGFVRRLYDIDGGAFDGAFGSVELPRVEGEPRMFVVSNGGAGIPVFRRLQREGVPFAAGILAENDIDYELARLLAVDVVTSPAFEPVGEDAVARALAYVGSCERVICAGGFAGAGNARVAQVVEAARAAGKLERVRPSAAMSDGQAAPAGPEDGNVIGTAAAPEGGI